MLPAGRKRAVAPPGRKAEPAHKPTWHAMWHAMWHSTGGEPERYKWALPGLAPSDGADASIVPGAIAMKAGAEAQGQGQVEEVEEVAEVAEAAEAAARAASMAARRPRQLQNQPRW